jgi:hypothetical protein
MHYPSGFVSLERCLRNSVTELALRSTRRTSDLQDGHRYDVMRYQAVTGSHATDLLGTLHVVQTSSGISPPGEGSAPYDRAVVQMTAIQFFPKAFRLLLRRFAKQSVSAPDTNVGRGLFTDVAVEQENAFVAQFLEIAHNEITFMQYA